MGVRIRKVRTRLAGDSRMAPSSESRPSSPLARPVGGGDLRRHGHYPRLPMNDQCPSPIAHPSHAQSAAPPGAFTEYSAAPPAGEAAECVDEAARQGSLRPGRIGPPSRSHPIGGCSENGTVSPDGDALRPDTGRPGLGLEIMRPDAERRRMYGTPPT